MLLRVTNTYAFLSGRVPVDLWAALTERLSYSRQEYRWVPEQRRKAWRSVRVSLLGQTEQGVAYFPSGLFARVNSLLREYNADLVFAEEPGDDTMTQPIVTRLHDGKDLYEDQLDAVRAALFQRKGLLALATNFGKTEVISSLCATLRGRPALVLVNQKTLARQTAKRLQEQIGEPVGLWGGGKTLAKVKYKPRVVVATVQALALKRNHRATQEWLSEVELLLVDEVHTVSPPSWYPVLELCTNAWLRIGMSGTAREVPYPMAMEAFFGPIVHEVRDAELIQQGRSASTTVLMPRVGNMLEENPDYRAIYDRGIVRSFARNEVLASFAGHAATLGLPTLVSFYRLEHGEVLERLCRERFLGQVLRIDGRSSYEEVARVQVRAAAGEPGIYLLGYSSNTGLDLPGARVLVNAAAWRSPVATSQRGGRIIRRKVLGGNWAVIVDPYDLGNMTFKNQSQDRKKIYEEKGFQVEVDAPELLLARLAGLVAAASTAQEGKAPGPGAP